LKPIHILTTLLAIADLGLIGVAIDGFLGFTIVGASMGLTVAFCEWLDS
jgi:hypothetical protein